MCWRCPCIYYLLLHRTICCSMFISLPRAGVTTTTVTKGNLLWYTLRHININRIFHACYRLHMAIGTDSVSRLCFLKLMPATRSTTVEPRPACPKCSIIKRTGTLSCCPQGGAWFKKCGDFGDSNFDHTWVEGIEACKGLRTDIQFYFIGYKCLT